MIIHNSVCLFYFCSRKDGNIPPDGVNILADCSPTYDKVINHRPPFPLPSAAEEVNGVNLEPCPAYMSATEGVSGVNMGHEYEDTEICRPLSLTTSATEEVSDYLEICPANMSATEEVGAT